MKNINIIIFTAIFLTSCSFQKTEAPKITEEISSTGEVIVQQIQKVVPEVVEEPIPEYLEIEKDGIDLVFEKVLAETSLYTRYQISYTSEGFSISGIMNIPKGEGRFPLVVFNHGYIDTSVYTNGRGLKREQNYFANNGFAVLHTDYRNHAFSDNDTSLNGTGGILRSKKYGADAINAILAVQNAKQEGLSEVKYIDSENVGMLGHSMGGGVTMYGLVSQPKLISAAVLYAPVHSNEFYNFQKWGKNRLSTSEIQGINNIYGNSEDSESFESISPETYFRNIRAPVQMYFGTNDQSCPIAWGYEIESALTDAGKDIDFTVYEGEQHEFGPQWENFMSSSVTFFNTHLR